MLETRNAPPSADLGLFAIAVGRWVGVAILLVAMLPGAAAGQDGPAVGVGDRVRVASDVRPDGPLVGTLLRLEPGALVLRPSPEAAEVRVPVGSVSHLEVRVGEGSRWKDGMGVGFLSGAVVGALYGALDAGTGPGEIDLPTSHAMGIGALLIGAGGALMGAIIGSTLRAERWEVGAIPVLSFRLVLRGRPAPWGRGRR